MHKTQKQVLEMMKALNLSWNYKPTLENLNFELLTNLVSEEAGEFDHAMSKLRVHIGNTDEEVIYKLWAEVIDAMCDLIVVIHNTSNAMGIDLEPYFDEVHRTNMAKVGGPKNEYGKAMKPVGWKPPRIFEMLNCELEK